MDFQHVSSIEERVKTLETRMDDLEAITKRATTLYYRQEIKTLKIALQNARDRIAELENKKNFLVKGIE